MIGAILLMTHAAAAQSAPGAPSPESPDDRGLMLKTDTAAPFQPGQPSSGRDVPSSVSAAAPPTKAPDSPSGAPGNLQLSTLKILRDKGILSAAEYDSAVTELQQSTGARAADANTLVFSKWAATIYGFAEGDAIYDSTQSLTEISGNTQIARPGTFAGDHDRTEFSVRNSRFGIRLKAPEMGGIRVSGQFEGDFFGNQMPIGYTGAAGTQSESAYYNNAAFRVRHFNLKMETPIVDILVGQTWSLFGWQAMYLPNSVQLQPMPGEIFSRAAQFRVSKTAKTDDITAEIAVAASRPPQRDSAVPDLQGGLRFAVNKVTAMQTINGTGTSIQPLSVAVTGVTRQFRLPELSADPKTTHEKRGAAFAVDAFIPVLTATKDHKGNSLALNGEFSYGAGHADLYTGLNGGVSNPALPAPAAGGTAPTFDPKVDAGDVVYGSDGLPHVVQWTNWIAGLQYYLPGLDGRVWISGNVAHTTSDNARTFGAAAKLRSEEFMVDGNLFFDPTVATRFGFEYANFKDTYADGMHAINHRLQMSGYFLF